MPVRSFVIGVLLSSFLWGFLLFALNFGTKLPNFENLEERYETYEYSITENRSLYDVETKRTLLWTPGNPKNRVVDVKELPEGRWQVTIEKVY